MNRPPLHPLLLVACALALGAAACAHTHPRASSGDGGPMWSAGSDADAGATPDAAVAGAGADVGPTEEEDDAGGTGGLPTIGGLPKLGGADAGATRGGPPRRPLPTATSRPPREPREPRRPRGPVALETGVFGADHTGTGGAGAGAVEPEEHVLGAGAEAPGEAAGGAGIELAPEPGGEAAEAPGDAAGAGTGVEGAALPGGAAGAGEAAPAPALGLEAGEDPNVVTVFYGTDRKRLTAEEDAEQRHRSARVKGLAGLGVVAFFALLAWRRPRRRWLWGGLAGLSFVGTLALLLMTLQPLMRKGEAPDLVYGPDRGKLELGTARISIPPVHEIGEVESPSIIRLELAMDADKHVVLQSIEPLDTDDFFTKLRARVDRSETKAAFVFVHGFNYTFENAIRRTAQISWDLKQDGAFDGAPILYSWPSQGSELMYKVDEANVEWTVHHLTEFLEMVATRSGTRTIHLVAHSMGNRALTRALQAMRPKVAGGELPRFKEVVLTAPDIDADVFKSEIAPAVMATAERVTLYASANDEALKLSKTIHGYPRAGDAGEDLVLLPGMDTVDVSRIDTSFLGHSYYGSNQTVLDDLVKVLMLRLPAPSRPHLHSRAASDLTWWEFVPTGPAASAGAAGDAPAAPGESPAAAAGP